MSKQVLVTKESINKMLGNPNKQYVSAVIGRALTELLKRQTKEEQNVGSTIEHNNIGFTGADAHSATLTARFWNKHGKLLDWQIEAWCKPAKSGDARLAKYHKQLNEIALEKKQPDQLNLEV